MLMTPLVAGNLRGKRFLRLWQGQLPSWDEAMELEVLGGLRMQVCCCAHFPRHKIHACKLGTIPCASTWEHVVMVRMLAGAQHALMSNDYCRSAQRKAAVPEPLQDFTAILQAINDSHDCIGPKRYLLAPEALQLFKQFETASIEQFNATAGLDVGSANTKDTRYVLRCTAMVSEAF